MTETQKDTIALKQNNIEIWQYPAFIQAEVIIREQEYKSASELGLTVLAGYIFRDNFSKQKRAFS